MAPTDQFVKAAWTLASIAVVVAALYLAKGILVPMTLAVLLSFLLSPVCDLLERLKLGRIPAVMVTALVGSIVLGGALWMAVVQVTELAPKVPEYERNLKEKLHSANVRLSAVLSKFSESAQGMSENLPQLDPAHAPEGTSEWPFSVRVISSPASPLQVFGGVFGNLLEVLGSAGMVIVVVVFFLIRRDDLRDRFIRLVGQGHVALTTQMLEEAGTRVTHYLAMQFLINAIYGAAVAVGLYWIGVPNAVLWGILATTLRFIPYFGPWIAAAMPIGLSMAISRTWLEPGLTIGLFVVLELITNNVLEPWLYGQKTGVSAVAVLLAAVFWTWLWGIVGLLLATPLTVCLLVLGKHVPQLSFLDTLLGNEPVFEPKTRIYQRLLAGDQEEATELLDGYLEQQPLVEVYDTVLIPALAMAETRWHRGELDESRREFILQTMKEMIQEQGERQQAARDKQEREPARESDAGSPRAGAIDSPKFSILCLPAHDAADELAGMMLAQVAESPDCQVETVSATTTASQLIELVAQRQAAVVCISSAPPSTVAHARYLCLRLRRRFPHMTLVVGLWDAAGDLKKAKERIGEGGTTHLVATLADASERIRSLIEPLQPPMENHVAAVDEARILTTASS